MESVDSVVARLALSNLAVVVYDTHVHLGSDPMPVHYADLAKLFALLAAR